ncbi:MAG: PDZ domain-containing protein [Armatimonadetes bacterium]|nr:PDZ domain-containing protein [Armatimonadota bacterium]
MSDWKKSVGPAVAALAAIGSFIWGSEVRTRQELGAAPKKTGLLDVASIELSPDSGRNIPEGEYFYQLTRILERDYIEPVADERKLAYGAVKGMVLGLWDPLSQFHPADHLAEAKDRLKGTFHGVGIEIRAGIDPSQVSKARKNIRSADPAMLFPEIVVATVLPGSPAERAGMKVGDVIRGVNGKSVLSWRDIKALRDMQDAVSKGKGDAAALKSLRTDFQKRAKAGIGAMRAADLLTSGSGTTLSVEWSHGGKVQRADVETAVLKLPSVEVDGQTVVLRMFEGAAHELGSKLPPGDVTIDLRQSTIGACKEVLPVLSVLAPRSQFGEIVREKGGTSKTLTTTNGAPVAKKLTLLVDRSTRGAAEILASALTVKNFAVAEGGAMAGEPVWTELRELEDGSGYTLNEGRYQSESVEASR